MRRRRGRLTFLPIALIAFFGFLAIFLMVEFIGLFDSAGETDWLLVAMLLTTLVLFILMGLAVFFLDFEQDLRLTRQGIYVVPPVFKTYLIPWDDIEKLEIRDSQGYKSIEYRLKPGSPSFQKRFGKNSVKKLISLEGRSGGFHGAIPAQNFRTEVPARQTEQNLMKTNKLFPILWRYWVNDSARAELPELTE
jgi:hypothetical protein